MVQGVVRGPTDLAAHAETLSPAQLRALKFGADPQTREIGYPKKTVFRTALHQIDDELLEQVLLGWQSQVLGPWQDQIVIVDGKKVRHAGVEIVNAADSQGRFLGSTVTARKSNGIPAAGQLLGGLDLTGKIILSDALHPNQERAQPMVFEGGGDYLMTVKGHQPTLEELQARRML